MNHALIVLLILFADATIAFAQQTHDLRSIDGLRPDFRCVFENPVVFGASISAGYSGLVDGVNGRRAAPKLYFGSNPGPATKFAQAFGNASKFLNLSEISSTAYPSRGVGYRQIESALRNPAKRLEIENSSAWVSVEGFYWPAIEGDLDETIDGLKRLISAARNLRKPLFIGNVPNENPDTVDRIVKWAGWAPPRPEFVRVFNTFLEQSCLRKEECYIVDLHETVRRLNSEGLIFRNRVNFVEDFRFDGVHLRPIAIDWLMSLMQGEVGASPPTCLSNRSR